MCGGNIGDKNREKLLDIVITSFKVVMEESPEHKGALIMFFPFFSRLHHLQLLIQTSEQTIIILDLRHRFQLSLLWRAVCTDPMSLDLGRDDILLILFRVNEP